MNCLRRSNIVFQEGSILGGSPPVLRRLHKSLLLKTRALKLSDYWANISPQAYSFRCIFPLFQDTGDVETIQNYLVWPHICHSSLIVIDEQKLCHNLQLWALPIYWKVHTCQNHWCQTYRSYRLLVFKGNTKSCRYSYYFFLLRTGDQ